MKGQEDEKTFGLSDASPNAPNFRRGEKRRNTDRMRRGGEK